MGQALKVSLLVGISLFGASVAVCSGQEPGWTPQVIKRGVDREVSENTNILQRPYRPLHFYGNTIRRAHYRGRAIPTAQDLRVTTRLVIRR